MLEQNVDDVWPVKAGTSDTELGDILGDLWLLSLDFMVELALVNDLALNGLGARLLAGSLKVSDELLDILGSNEAKNECVAIINIAFALVLESAGEGWKVGEVEGWGSLS